MNLPRFNDLRAACDFCGVVPPDSLIAGQLIRTPTLSHRRSKNGYIRIFSDGAAIVGNWENGLEAFYSDKSGKTLSRQERAELRRQSEQRRRETERELKTVREGICQRLNVFFGADYGAYPTVSMEWQGTARHPYLEKKHVEPTETMYECRRENFEAYFGKDYQRLPEGRLLVFPLINTTGDLISAQFIAEDGSKYFLRNGQTKGAFWQATFLPIDRGAPFKIHIAEGVATLLSVLQQSETLSGVFISCMNAGNIKPVAKAMREAYPATEIVMYADVDKPRDGHRYGVGIEKAQEAQAEVANLRILAPKFNDSDIQRFKAITGSDKAPTDWNDYYRIWEARQ
ncbi:toprim domain-containing protein [Parasutterella excrementihominis]|uniref:toprim domain-containing protein n=1 Tax=Parasutterella excrementihominis TaxID=487175 RepID=UPI003AF0C766